MFPSAGKLQVTHKEEERQIAWNLGRENTKTISEKDDSISFKSTFRKNRSSLLFSPMATTGCVEGSGWFGERFYSLVMGDVSS